MKRKAEMTIDTIFDETFIKGFEKGVRCFLSEFMVRMSSGKPIDIDEMCESLIHHYKTEGFSVDDHFCIERPTLH